MDLRPGLQRCPAHQDRRSPSLSVSRGADGRWLLHCFAGCETADVLRAAGLTWAALASPSTATSGLPSPRPVQRSIEERARDAVLAKSERARARRQDWLLEWRAVDRARVLHGRAERLRAIVTRLGPEHEGAWALADLAAKLDRQAGMLDAAVWTGD